MDKLISQKLILEELREHRSNVESDDHAFNLMYCIGIGNAINRIEMQPAVDAEIITHGKWIRHGMDIAEHPWRCSVCSWGNHHIDRYVPEFDRCPQCGAIMN